MTLSLVLPCYNEEGNIATTVRQVDSWLSKQSFESEIIVVDDGSKDASPKILEELRKGIHRLRVVRHDKNGGYGIAVRSGCDAATKEWIAFMDSDGQFRVEDLALLIAHIDKYSFITGRRRKRADSFVRNTFGKILGIMNVVMLGIWVRDVNCGMKMFTQETWKKIRPENGVEKLFNAEIFMNLKEQNIPWFQVDVPHYPRTIGNPTGGSVRVIKRMFEELAALRKAHKKSTKH